MKFWVMLNFTKMAPGGDEETWAIKLLSGQWFEPFVKNALGQRTLW